VPVQPDISPVIDPFEDERVDLAAPEELWKQDWWYRTIEPLSPLRPEIRAKATRAETESGNRMGTPKSEEKGKQSKA